MESVYIEKENGKYVVRDDKNNIIYVQNQLTFEEIVINFKDLNFLVIDGKTGEVL
jgi:hypothetical protein